MIQIPNPDYHGILQIPIIGFKNPSNGKVVIDVRIDIIKLKELSKLTLRLVPTDDTYQSELNEDNNENQN